SIPALGTRATPVDAPACGLGKALSGWRLERRAVAPKKRPDTRLGCLAALCACGVPELLNRLGVLGRLGVRDGCCVLRLRVLRRGDSLSVLAREDRAPRMVQRRPGEVILVQHAQGRGLLTRTGIEQEGHRAERDSRLGGVRDP